MKPKFTLWLVWWYGRRIARMFVAVPLAVVRLTASVIPDIWSEKLSINIVSLTVDEENTLRGARAKLARFLNVDRISPEEYLSLTGAIVPFYCGQRDEMLSKSELTRILFGRRRARPERVIK
jgi:hypothetical protein